MDSASVFDALEFRLTEMNLQIRGRDPHRHKLLCHGRCNDMAFIFLRKSV